jgi:hypothetical protein
MLDHCARSLSSIRRISRSSRRASSRAACNARREPGGSGVRLTNCHPARAGTASVAFTLHRCGGLPTLAKQLLDPADRVPLLIEELPDLPEQVDVLGPVIAASTSAFERLDLRKFGFPEPEHMRRQFEFLRNLPGRAKGSLGLARAPGSTCRVQLGHLRQRMPWRSWRFACGRRWIGSDRR